jgi:prepilin-type N-terminal cleavage/methylation domain-containing protein
MISHICLTIGEVKRMNKYKRKQGFTLIEVIVSFAIFAIVSIVFLSAFSTGLTGIFYTGRKEKTINTAKSMMDENIRMGSGTAADTIESGTLTINYPSITIPIDGKYVTVTQNDGRNTVKFTYFIP